MSDSPHRRTDEMCITVMKFGGTSVASAEGRAAIATRVQEALESGRSPVIVVSAMGRLGEPYSTDSLIELLGDAPTDLRERDLLMATGEIISAVVVAHELRASGIQATALSGPEAGIGTDGVAGSSTIKEIHPGPVRSACSRGLVPIVAGFQGMSADGRLTTLGRGGSDTTACALGVALDAECVEIYTDVDGVMSADPRTCSDSSVLESLGADELFQMAAHGSKVVHTPAAELALASGMSVRVRNTYSDHPGTSVSDMSLYRPERVATAVSHLSGVARIRVPLPGGEGERAHMNAQTRIYEAMADAGVSLDMFTPAGAEIVLTVSKDSLARAVSVIGELDLDCQVREGLAKVTLVGAGMHGVPGVMARMTRYLYDGGVHVLQTADSHTTISVLVAEEEMAQAVHALHSGFELA